MVIVEPATLPEHLLCFLAHVNQDFSLWASNSIQMKRCRFARTSVCGSDADASFLRASVGWRTDVIGC